MTDFIWTVVITGTLGFLASRILSGVKRTWIDNAVVCVFSVAVAVILCLVINLGWTLDKTTYAAIGFLYVFFMDKSRMVQSFFSR